MNLEIISTENGRPIEELTSIVSNLGTELKLLNGYKYRKAAKSSRGVKWRCCRRYCKAAIEVNEVKGRFWSHNEHNHEPCSKIVRSIVNNCVKNGIRPEHLKCETPSSVFWEVAKTIPKTLFDRLTRQDLKVVKNNFYRNFTECRKKGDGILGKDQFRSKENLVGLLASCVTSVDSELASQTDGAASTLSKAAWKSDTDTLVDIKEDSGAGSVQNVQCTSANNAEYDSLPFASTSNTQYESGSGSSINMQNEVPANTSYQEEEFGSFERQLSYISSNPIPHVEETPELRKGLVIKAEASSVTLTDLNQTTPTTDTSVSLGPNVPIDVLQSDIGGEANESQIIENVQTAQVEISAKALESAIQRLETVSNKLTAASLVDSYDQFGKYISTVLRGLPIKKVHSLKQKIISEVMEVLAEEMPFPRKNVPREKQANATDRRFMLNQLTAANFPQNPNSYVINPPIDGQVSDLYHTQEIYPHTPPYQENQAPIRVPRIQSAADMNVPLPYTTRTPINPIQFRDGDALSNMNNSLFEGTGPTTTLSTTPRNDQCPPRSQRGRKCRKAKATDVAGKSIASSGTSNHVVTSADASSREDVPTATLEQSNYEQNFEMEIEEGNEMAEMKAAKYLFETVMCGSSSSVFIKEEAPDPEERDPIASASAPTQALGCHLCNTRCETSRDLVTHVTTSHPGCVSGVPGGGVDTLG